MRIWIDVREACRERKTGKGQWCLRCVTALLQRTDVQATLLTDTEIPAVWNGTPGLLDVQILRASGFRWHLRVWRLLRRQKSLIDLYLSPTSFIVPFLLGKTLKVVPVVHDLIAFKNEPHDRKATMIERMTLPRALRSASVICSVSDATAALVRERFGSNLPISTVGAGPTVDEENTWTGTGDHILCLATLCPRKNQLRLIEAYAKLPDSIRESTKLILVGGRGWDDEAIVQRATVTHGVRWMGFQDDATCGGYLRTCKAFAFVSEEEGFGLPVLDALRMGAPVLASDIPSIREVAGDAAVYADPLDIVSIAEGLQRVLTEESGSRREKGREQARRFSWENVANNVLLAYGTAHGPRL